MKNIIKALLLSLTLSLCLLAEAEDDDIVGINDTLKATSFDFAIISAETCENFQNGLGVEYTAEDGNEFLIIVFSALNTSERDSNAMYVGFDSYVDDMKTTVTSAAGEVNGYMPMIGSVAPGKTFECYSVWELPKGWEKLEFSYIDAGTGMNSDDKFTIYATDLEGGFSEEKPESAVSETEENYKDIVGINGTLKTTSFDFTIISAETCESFQNGLGVEYTAEDGNEFLIIVFSAMNTSDQDANAMYAGLDSYVDGMKTNIVATVGEVNGYMPMNGGVAPGKIFECYSVWELPKGWGKLEFSYIDAGTGINSNGMFTIYAADLEDGFTEGKPESAINETAEKYIIEDSNSWIYFTENVQIPTPDSCIKDLNLYSINSNLYFYVPDDSSSEVLTEMVEAYSLVLTEDCGLTLDDADGMMAFYSGDSLVCVVAKGNDSEAGYYFAVSPAT